MGSSSTTPVRIGLLGASPGDVLHLAGLLRQRFHDEKIEARVEIIEVPVDLLEIAGIEILFLSGLAPTAAADARLQTADTTIRTALCRGNASYQVLYGNDEQQVQQALDAVLPLTRRACDPGQGAVIQTGQQVASPWIWTCEKCSDAACEHKLLSDLLKQRQRTSAL